MNNFGCNDVIFIFKGILYHPILKEDSLCDHSFFLSMFRINQVTYVIALTEIIITHVFLRQIFKFQFLLFATSVQNAQCVNGSFQNIFNWEERLHMFQKLDYLLL